MAHADPAVGLVGATPLALRGAVRAARWSQLGPLIAGDDARAFASPTALAAWLALTGRVPRVVVAATPDALDLDLLAIAAPGPRAHAERAALIAAWSPARPPLLLSLSDGIDAAEVARARTRGAYFCAPGGRFHPPGVARAVRVCGAALALAPVAGAPGPPAALCALDRQRSGDDEDPRVEAGALVLGADRHGRVTIARNPPPAQPASRRAESSAPLPALRDAFEALTRDHAYRHQRGPRGLEALRRDAERLLRAEVSAGRVAAWTLDVAPDPDAPAGALIDARVRLPRRVEQVLLRVRAPT